MYIEAPVHVAFRQRYEWSHLGAGREEFREEVRRWHEKYLIALAELEVKIFVLLWRPLLAVGNFKGCFNVKTSRTV